MCYKGGPRCKDECTRTLGIAETKKSVAEEKLSQLKVDLARKMAGEKVFDNKGVSKRLSTLRNEETKLLQHIAKQQAVITAAKEEIRLSPESIEDLRVRSEDMSLSPEKRGVAAAAMKAAMDERSRLIKQGMKNESVRNAIADRMKVDGFDSETIAECNPSVSNDKLIRSPNEYRKRLYAATARIDSLKRSRDAELQGASSDEERMEIRNKFSPLIANEVRVVRVAERDYYSTRTGLNELKAEAEYRPREMTTDEWHARVIKYEAFARRYDEKKTEKTLRDQRRNRIQAAYTSAGKDPSTALALLDAQETKKTDKRPATPENLLTNRSGTILLTEEGWNKFHNGWKASGSPLSFSAYARETIMGPLQKHLHNKPLAEVNKEAERFSDGGWHRQATHSTGLRTKKITFKMTALEHEALKVRSQSLNTTISSYGEPILTGRDPRMIQNDRSARANEIKTALASKMTPKKKL